MSKKTFALRLSCLQLSRSSYETAISQSSSQRLQDVLLRSAVARQEGATGCSVVSVGPSVAC